MRYCSCPPECKPSAHTPDRPSGTHVWLAPWSWVPSKLTCSGSGTVTTEVFGRILGLSFGSAYNLHRHERKWVRERNLFSFQAGGPGGDTGASSCPHPTEQLLISGRSWAIDHGLHRHLSGHPLPLRCSHGSCDLCQNEYQIPGRKVPGNWTMWGQRELGL
jgi:hypothetical protein